MNDFLVEFLNDRVEESSGEFEGRPWRRRIQEGHVFLPGEKYPVPVGVRLEERQPPYSPGRYRWVNPVHFRRGALEVPRYWRLERISDESRSASARSAASQTGARAS